MDKALGLEVDAVILCLEDAVAVGDKASARANAISFLRNLGSPAATVTRPLLVVRVNGEDTAFGAEDVFALEGVRDAVDVVCVPKVESCDAVSRISASLALPVWAMVETPRGILQVGAFAGAESLAALVFGSQDLTNDLRARHTPDRAPLHAHMSAVVAAARTYGVLALDAVSPLVAVDRDPSQREAFAAECAQGRDFGFDGKTLIHPSQVLPCNEAFSPTEAEVDFARRAVAAADASGGKLCVVDNRIVEALHVRRARLLLQQHQAILEHASRAR
jgi:(3S)-malyl-CoA thioesterase